MKTKRTISFLFLFCSLAVISFSCKDDLPLPEINNVEIEGGETVDGKVKITVGENLTFSLKIANVDINKYEWYVDNELVNSSEKFKFTPEKRGEYKISVKVYNGDGAVTEKAIGEIQVIDPAPLIESFTVENKAVEDIIEVPYIPDSVVFRVKSSNVEIAGYKWLYNEEEIEDASVDTLKMLPKYSGKLKVVLTNLDGVTTEQEVGIEGAFKEGLFLFGTTTIGLSFYDPDTETFFRGKDGDIYQQINKEVLGDGGINDFFIYNNKIYLLVPTSKEKKARVVIADAQTLAKIDIITAENFNTQTLGEIYNLAIIDDDKAYIGNNKSISGNISGVRVLNMKDKTLSEPIEGTAGKLGVEGPAWSRMLKVGNDVMVGCGSKIQIIDGNTDKVKKTIEIDKDRQIVDIVKGKDKNIYALVAGKVDKSSATWLWNPVATTSPSVVKIKSEDYSVAGENELLIDGKGITIKSGLQHANTTVSLKSDDIYFVEGGWSSNKVYVYNYTSGVVKEFTDKSGKSGLLSYFSGYMGTDKEGNVFIPTTNYTRSSVGKFGQFGSYSEETYRVNGDANVISTYQFN